MILTTTIVLAIWAAPSVPDHPWCPPYDLDRAGRKDVVVADLEADALARPTHRVNPVDLGTVLVPHGWLLLGPSQEAAVEVAALSRSGDIAGARVAAWFESQPANRRTIECALMQGTRRVLQFAAPPTPKKGESDGLWVSITDAAGNELWHKRITVMLVQKPPVLPAFGAVSLKLRYDAPISIRDRQTGALSSMPYDEGWSDRLSDVVVCLPGGARFVFWRGASYVPFWASRFNTALCYEWAETGPLPDGFVDSVEPLMDKELRYGRVEIVESTPARVHVRWTYQSTDFEYKVWGDLAVEDFYFYPDGFGTRVLSLKTGLESDYELSEFIILTPKDTYPLQVFAPDPVRAIYVDGEVRQFTFPFTQPADADIRKPRDVPAVWRVKLNRDEPMTAVYFHPADGTVPPVIFGPFSDRGRIVTPAYWGSHWPLARGKTTGAAIDDRVHLTPCHNSLMTWARHRPSPLRTATMPSIDTLGRSRTMRLQEWAWLIGMTDEPDDPLVERARCFASPPSFDVQGARYDLESYAIQRRAVRLVMEADTATINVKPQMPWVNPVFELLGAAGTSMTVSLDGRALQSSEYRWDGCVLWLSGRIVRSTSIEIRTRRDGQAR